MCGTTPHRSKLPLIGRSAFTVCDLVPAGTRKVVFATAGDGGAAERGDRRLRVEEVGLRPIHHVLRRQQVVVDLHDDLRAGLEVDARGRREGRRRPSPGPSRRSWACRRRPCRRSTSTPRPPRPRPWPGRRPACPSATENRITWCTVAVEPGVMLKPIRSCACASAGIDQRAVVVVGQRHRSGGSRRPGPASRWACRDRARWAAWAPARRRGPLGRALRGPGAQHGDLVSRQHARVADVAAARRGHPRRHDVLRGRGRHERRRRLARRRS